MAVVTEIAVKLTFLACFPVSTEDKIPENIAIIIEKKGKFCTRLIRVPPFLHPLKFRLNPGNDSAHKAVWSMPASVLWC